MAKLPEQITATVLELQKRLLEIINLSTATGFLILQEYGETEATVVDLEQLDNVRDRADTYYSRFYNVLRRIAESQPTTTNAMLELLERSIEDAQATVEALEATIEEIKKDWNIP